MQLLPHIVSLEKGYVRAHAVSHLKVALVVIRVIAVIINANLRNFSLKESIDMDISFISKRTTPDQSIYFFFFSLRSW